MEHTIIADFPSISASMLDVCMLRLQMFDAASLIADACRHAQCPCCEPCDTSPNAKHMQLTIQFAVLTKQGVSTRNCSLDTCCLLQDLMLPTNVTATTSMAEAIAGARYAVHALPVQHSRAFLTSIKVCWLAADRLVLHRFAMNMA